jgi:hypothetical protein
MAENKMILMSPKTGDLPMESNLCVFRFESDKDIFILGVLLFKEKEGKFIVKRYGKEEIFDAELFQSYQYVLNENGGYYFV